MSMPRAARQVFGFAIAILAAVLWIRNDESSSRVAGRRVAADVTHDAISTSTTVAVAPTTSTNAFIIRAVDGDTLIARLDGETEEVKVRLLGVNTPESVDPRRPVQCFGKEASRHAASLTDGKRARLEEDPEADDRDKYHRLLRNVILEDGVDLNLALVRDGYANAYTSFPMNKKRKAEIRRLQDEARREKRGLWNPETCDGRK